MTMECPDDEAFAAFAQGSLPAAECAEIADHAGSCETCHAMISELLVDSTQAENEGARVVVGSGPTTIERYRVVRRLGAGAMGVVYEAHDPELDRAIAIKLLRPGASADRLRREAQALAKLTHPNVVGVYDVGPYDNGTFVAMALVDGVTLRVWLQSPRATAEIIDVILQTARGVAAAHAAGIVHRDLKPDNIFVSHDDEVRVGDFGLARSDGAPSERSSPDDRPIEVTQTGTLLGTPAYMAPEQASGEAIAASDQFSLCVTAWEALHGTRPFAGRTTQELIDAAHAGKIVESTSARRIPRRIDRALRRGLAAAPEDRHASIDALITAISPRPVRWPMIAATILVLGTAAIVAIVMFGTSDRRDPCGDVGPLAMTWSPARRLQLGAMLARVPGHAPEFATVALHDVDAYVADWSEVRRQTCEATQVRHERSPENAEQVSRCLDRGATITRRLIDSIGTESNLNASNILARLEGLEPVEHCLDVTATKTASPALENLQSRLAELGLDESTVDAPLLGTDLDDVVTRARSIGDPDVVAQALLLAGVARLGRGQTAAAEQQLRQAMTFADTARDDRTRARACAWLMELLVRAGRLGEASTQRDVAIAARDRSGADPLTDVLIEHATASIARAATDAPTEIRSLQRIVEIEIAHHGSTSESAISAMEELAYAMERAGDPALQTVLDQQARARAQVTSSAEVSLDAAHSAAGAAVLRGDFVEAIRDEEHAAALALRTPTSDAPAAVMDLGLMYEITSDFVRAQHTFRDVVRLIDAEPANLRDVPMLVEALQGEGRDALLQAETTDASASARTELATTALAATDRAVPLASATSIDTLEAQRGRSLVALARWKEALPVMRAALSRAEADQPRRPFAIAMRSFLLARVLWEIGDAKDREHARVLGAQAATAFAQTHELFAAQASLVSLLQTVDREAATLATWRAAHP